VLAELAQELELDTAGFAAAFARLAGPATDRHFADSRQWLARCRGQGFPTIAFERDDGTLERLDIGPWLGRVADWTAHLRRQVPAAVTTETRSKPVCQGRLKRSASFCRS